MNLSLDERLQLALIEDIGPGDVTCEGITSQCGFSRAEIISKSYGVVCGVDVAARVFELVDDRVQTQVLVKDGDPVDPFTHLIYVSGSAQSILKGERTALNFLGWLSGIATTTRKFVDAAGPNGPRILDTRKTLPLWRDLAKRAVRAGGGHNHRFGLYDMVLLKENHLIVTHGVKRAVELIRERHGDRYIVEVETTTLDEVREALEAGVDRIMLDNMTNEEVYQAVRIVQGRVRLEVSGNVTLERMPLLITLGVDDISVGCLTHSVQDIDVSLLFFHDEDTSDRIVRAANPYTELSRHHAPEFADAREQTSSESSD